MATLEWYYSYRGVYYMAKKSMKATENAAKLAAGHQAIEDAAAKATENAAKLAAGRKAIKEAAQKKDSTQLKSALLGYVGVLEQTEKGLTFPGNKAAQRKVVTAFVKDAVGLRGYNIAPLYAGTLTELAGKNQDAAGSFFLGAPELYRRLGPRYVSDFVAQGLGKKPTPDYFAGASLDAQGALHDLVEKEHLKYVGNYRKLDDKFKQHKANVVKSHSEQKRHLRLVRTLGIMGTIFGAVVGGVLFYNAGTSRPSSSANRARIEALVDQRDEYKARLSSVEAERDQARAGLRTTYGARVHDAIENPQALTEITDEWLDTIGERMCLNGPGCEPALGNLHTAMGGYVQDRPRFVQALDDVLDDVVCPRISPDKEYVCFFSK